MEKLCIFPNVFLFARFHVLYEIQIISCFLSDINRVFVVLLNQDWIILSEIWFVFDKNVKENMAVMFFKKPNLSEIGHTILPCRPPKLKITKNNIKKTLN